MASSSPVRHGARISPSRFWEGGIVAMHSVESSMASDDISKRLETLEMTVDGLSGLPAQVAGLDGRVAALDSRVTALDARVESLELQFFQFREEVRDEFSVVRKEIKDESEQTRAVMRTLHEEVISRIKVLNEGKGTPR